MTVSEGPTWFIFETTHHALWAEEVALEAAIAVEVVPAPAAARARCNLALQTLPEEIPALAETLDRSEVPFEIWTADSL